MKQKKKIIMINSTNFCVFQKLINAKVELDPRPEYARARILSRQGKFFAEITDNQVRQFFGNKLFVLFIQIICQNIRIHII